MLAVSAQQPQQQQPVGLAWLLPALGSAATASCQFVCPQWAHTLSQSEQVMHGHTQRLDLNLPTGAFPSHAMPSPGWLARLPPLFAPTSKQQQDSTQKLHSSQHCHNKRANEEASPQTQPQDQHLKPSHSQLAKADQSRSFKSCDNLSRASEESSADGHLSECDPSSEGSQQTSSSALEALLAVADTCTNTGCLTSEEAIQAARQRYEQAKGRLSQVSFRGQGDSPRSNSALRAGPRRSGAFAGVSKLTAQQRRARHRCNNPWSIGETQALLEGIERCGVGKWADIQRLRLPTIIRRSPVDLKDKWRNLSRLAQDPNTGRANNTVPRHLLLEVRRILGLQCN